MLKMKSKLFISVPILIVLLVLVGFIIPRITQPSSDTRIVLEHTYRTYIVPSCFEESDATNFLEESTIQKARELNYKPHSSCTEDALKGDKDRLIVSLLKEIGIVDKKWDNW
ncbi:hypothetical protein HMPREF9372_3741 [Sporosarcina newyorkensis 2681]|uniref:Uncharacterized protein n=1 Tax=Sporosarcina newyorkensis 2681 TaxID=1027292 RepID=F9DY60_9BACL|nr:hypothetical protein [Sporosarcina newyorkensis]EGQ19273.1 hypothetical protein HMPREF9372_3741 [Sporosarcina newyorkensis 2681]